MSSVSREDLVIELLMEGSAVDSSGNSISVTNSGADLTTDSLNRPNRAFDFVSANSDKFTLGSIGNIRTVVIEVKLDSTTEAIFEGDPNAHTISASSGTLSYGDWDNAYVNGVDTNTVVADTWYRIVITSTTDVNCTAPIIGLNNATYGDFVCRYFAAYANELSAEEVANDFADAQGYTGLFKDATRILDFTKDIKDLLGNTITNVGADLGAFNPWGVSNQGADFVASNSDKITVGSVGNTKTVVFLLNLDSTTEAIFEGDPNAHTISASTGTLSYGDWDNAFVDGVDTDTIGTGWTTLIVTSSTDVNCTDIELGLNNATYGDLQMSFFASFSKEFSSADISALHQILQKKIPRPLLKGGVI